jgi:hypothetical protein
MPYRKRFVRDIQKDNTGRQQDSKNNLSTHVIAQGRRLLLNSGNVNRSPRGSGEALGHAALL